MRQECIGQIYNMGLVFEPHKERGEVGLLTFEKHPAAFYAAMR